MILNFIYAFIATMGFGIIFNIRGRKLFFASLGGGFTWSVYLASLNFNSSIIFSLFIASVLGGLYSEVMSRILKTPVTNFVICAIITLVPGGGMYNTMYETITGNIDKSLRLGLETLSNAGSIAIGIILVSSLSRLLNQRVLQK